MIPKFDDLVELANKLYDLGYGEEELIVSFPIRNRDLFIKVNEEFHYRFNTEEEIDNDIEEINISIGNTKFRYYLVLEEEDA